MSRSPKSDDENGCYGSTSRTIVDSFSYKIVQFLGFKQVLGIVFLFVWIPVCLWVGGFILNLNFSQSNRDCSASECIFLHGGCLPIRARGYRGKHPNGDQNLITLQCSFHSELHLVLLPDIKEYKYCWGSASK